MLPPADARKSECDAEARLFFAERSRTRGFRSGRQCTLFISKINISMKITKLLFPPAGERKDKTTGTPRAPSLRRADASQTLKSAATKRRRCLTSLRNGGRRRAPTALPFLPTIRRFPALPHKKKPPPHPPLSQTSHVSVPPIARGPPFSIPPHFLRVEGRDPSFRLSPEPDRDAPSAERFRLSALLCDFRLRRNSPPPARRASALPL